MLALVPEWALPALAQGDVDVPFTDIPATFIRQPAGRRNDGSLDIRKIDGFLTPDDQFFFIQHYNKPEIEPAAFRLKFTGLVNKPVELSLADLQSMRSVDIVNGYECSGNSPRAMQGLSSNGRFTGVRAARRAAPRRRGRQGARSGVLRRRQGQRGRRLPAEHAEGAAAVRAQHHARERDEAGADAGLGAQRPAARPRPRRSRCG